MTHTLEQLNTNTEPPHPRDDRNQHQTIKNETAEDLIEARCGANPPYSGPSTAPVALCTKGGLPDHPREHVCRWRSEFYVSLVTYRVLVLSTLNGFFS